MLFFLLTENKGHVSIVCEQNEENVHGTVVKKGDRDIWGDRTEDKYINESDYDLDDGELTVNVRSNTNRSQTVDPTVMIHRKLTYILLENLKISEPIYRKQIKRELTIGRKENCDFIIRGDKTVSLLHCTIYKTNGNDFVIEDNNSTNNTYINDEEVIGQKNISTGDILEIGRCKFRISIVKE